MQPGNVDAVPNVSASERLRLAIIAGVVGLLAANVGAAAACRGLEFPDRIQLQGTTLELNGLGVRKATFLRIGVYVAALYAPRSAAGATGAWPVRDAPTLIRWPGAEELVLRFVRGVGAGDIRHAFSEGFASAAGGTPLAALADRIRTLNGWVTDMHSGDSMTFVRTPERGIELEVDGRSKGVIAGEDFASALFAIWLGDRPPNPELKAGLLGGPCR